MVNKRMIAVNEYQQRRATLMQTMQHGVLVLPTAPEVARNRDSHYAYRFDSAFYYLTGFTEPEAVLVLIAGDAPQSILFCREKNLEREIWDGFRYGIDAAKSEFGFDAVYAIGDLNTRLPELMANQPQLFYHLGTSQCWDRQIIDMLNKVREQVRIGVTAPETMHDSHHLIDEMRLRKSSAELDMMRQSANIAAQAHVRAMRATQPNKMEYEIEAELLHTFVQHGARHPAYNSIVAGGKNACTLHYQANDARLQDGDLLLIDAGCELHGYASDITRTFPVNGRFSAPQKDLYMLVLEAQQAAIGKVSTAHDWNAPHQAALQVLIEGFIHYGLCQGSHDEVLETESYKAFYMHRTGHWLGLDVHDVGDYKTTSGDWCQLELGNVLTVEPGCYVRPCDRVPEHFWHIGIRIEDDVVVTEQGCEVLTGGVPKTIAEIEGLMAEAKA